jgi:hypothetical protein
MRVTSTNPYISNIASHVAASFHDATMRALAQEATVAKAEKMAYHDLFLELVEAIAPGVLEANALAYPDWGADQWKSQISNILIKADQRMRYQDPYIQALQKQKKALEQALAEARTENSALRQALDEARQAAKSNHERGEQR